MSIRVRLIGGLHDGEIVKVDDDQVEIARSKPVPVMPATGSRGYGLASSTTEIKVSRYTRRLASAADGGVVYFALAALSDLEALQHVLGV